MHTFIFIGKLSILEIFSVVPLCLKQMFFKVSVLYSIKKNTGSFCVINFGLSFFFPGDLACIPTKGLIEC